LSFAQSSTIKDPTENHSGSKTNTTADLIVINAKITVMDANRSIIEALAVKDCKILSTGSA
jgi:hypothetical protein